MNENTRLSFHETAAVFSDSMVITFSDPEHSIDEDRFITFDFSRLERLLVASHTPCGDRTSIISARLMTRQERRIYRHLENFQSGAHAVCHDARLSVVGSVSSKIRGIFPDSANPVPSGRRLGQADENANAIAA